MKYIPNGVSRLVSRQLLVTQKHSPAILFVTGVVGVGVTVVSACRATLKVEEIMDGHEQMSAIIDASSSRPDYDEGDRTRDVRLLKVRTTGKLVKLYAPTAVLAVLSIGALAGSHNILSKRNAGLTAAYAALDKGFREYRARVVDELGNEKDLEYRFGVQEIEVLEEGKNGVKHNVKKKVVGDGGGSIYSKLFDDRNENWNPEPSMNHFFLRAVQQNLNNNLQSRGHLFLNEAYDALGMDRTPEGSQVGWIYDKWNDIHGDNHVDFGIWDAGNMDRFHAFVTGAEDCIWLDFNVDGAIWKLI